MKITAVANEPRDFSFPRHYATTAAGYPLPLCGKPLTKTPVVVNQAGGRKYPESYIPAQEELAENEIRITCTGSGNPVIRRGQAETGWLVELGNGDKFIFDVGGGTVGNLWSLEIPPALLNKLFITHLHLDHVGGFFPLLDAMGWARNTPLHVWGPSGYTKEMGIEAFCENMQKAALWHIESKRGYVPSTGAKIIAHEFDASKFKPDNPRQLIYNENGVKIYAFPVIHTIFGAVGYRLEWKGLSMAFTGDSEPSTHEAEQSKGVDVFIHEGFITPEVLAQKNNIPLEYARNIVYKAHTPPDMLGRVFALAKPGLGVATHFFVNDDTVDPFFEDLHKNYDGPVVLAQDLTVINLTPKQIVTRMARTNLLHWAPPPPESEQEAKLATASEARIPDWLMETKIK